MDYLDDIERYDPEKHVPMEDALMAEFGEAMKLFVKYYNMLWD